MTRTVIRRGYVVCNGTREFPVRVNSPNSYVLLAHRKALALSSPVILSKRASTALIGWRIALVPRNDTRVLQVSIAAARYLTIWAGSRRVTANTAMQPY
jgi:hypothetical protein